MLLIALFFCWLDFTGFLALPLKCLITCHLLQLCLVRLLSLFRYWYSPRYLRKYLLFLDSRLVWIKLLKAELRVDNLIRLYHHRLHTALHWSFVKLLYPSSFLCSSCWIARTRAWMRFSWFTFKTLIQNLLNCWIFGRGNLIILKRRSRVLYLLGWTQ